jgi:hypothetical protein
MESALGFFSGIVFLIFITITVIFLMIFHLFNLKSVDSYHLALYLLFAAPFGAVTLLFACYLQCDNNVYWYSFLTTGARSVLLTSFFLAAIYFTEMSIGTPQMWGIILLSYFILLGFEYVLLLLRMPRGLLSRTLSLLNSKRIRVLDAASEKMTQQLDHTKEYLAHIDRVAAAGVLLIN